MNSVPWRPPARGRAASSRHPRHLRYAIAISILLVVTQSAGIIPAVFRDRLQAYLGIGDGCFGFLFSAGPLVGIVSALVSGAMVNRLGAVTMIRRGLRGMAVGMALMATSGSSWKLMFVSLMVCGLFAGPLNIAVSTYLTRLFPGERRRVLSLSLVISGAGGIVLPLVAEALLALPTRFTWISFADILHAPFAVIAVLLFTAGSMYRGQKRIPNPNDGGLWNGCGFRLPFPLIWLAFLLTLHGAADGALFTWMPKFLASTAFPSPRLAPGVVLSAYSLAYLASRSLIVGLPETWGRQRLLVLPGLIGGGVAVAGLLSGSFWLTVGGYVVGGFLWSAECPALLALLADRGKQSFTSAMALSGVLGGVINTAFLYGTGHLAARVGEGAMAQAMAFPASGFILVGLGGAAWLACFRHTLRTAAATPLTVAQTTQGFSPTALRREIRSTKHEIRLGRRSHFGVGGNKLESPNPEMTETDTLQTTRKVWSIRNSDLFRISAFGFRNSRTNDNLLP